MSSPELTTISLSELLRANQHAFVGTRMRKPDGTIYDEYKSIIKDLNDIVEQLVSAEILKKDSLIYTRGSALCPVFNPDYKIVDNPWMLTAGLLGCSEGLEISCNENYLNETLNKFYLINLLKHQPNIDIYFYVDDPQQALRAAELIKTKNLVVSTRYVLPNGITVVNIRVGSGNPQNESINLIFKHRKNRYIVMIPPNRIGEVDLRRQITSRQDAAKAILIPGEKDWRVVINPRRVKQLMGNEEFLLFKKYKSTIDYPTALHLLTRSIRFNARWPNQQEYGQLADQIRKLINQHFNQINKYEYLFTEEIDLAFLSTAELFWAFIFRPNFVLDCLADLPENVFPNFARHSEEEWQRIKERIAAVWAPINDKSPVVFTDSIIACLISDHAKLERSPKEIDPETQSAWESNIQVRDLNSFFDLFVAFFPLDIHLAQRYLMSKLGHDQPISESEAFNLFVSKEIPFD